MLATLMTLAATVAASPAGIEVTYLGNEGFLLAAGGRKVLVDALVSTDMTAYVDQEPDLRRKLLAAEPPFDAVDLVLATHEHGDHFDPEAVGRHLVANPGAVFVSTRGAVARLRSRFARFEEIRERVRAVAPKTDEPKPLPELGLTVLNLHHGKDRAYRTPDNHGFLIELGGLRVLHMGDTEVTAAELTPLKLPDRGIDVAFVPSWYLDARPWKGAVESAIRPQQTVVMHLAPRFTAEARTPNQRESRARAKRIRSAYPDAFIFERQRATRSFGSRSATAPSR